MNEIDKTKEEMSKQQEEAIMEAARNLEPLKILLVEDNHCGMRLLPTFFKEFNHEVILAYNGEEGVEVFRKRPDIDLILMDIHMPIIGGFQATQLIREFDKEIIIIALSAGPRLKFEKHAIEIGMNDYLQKPFKLAEILALLLKYFGE